MLREGDDLEVINSILCGLACENRLFFQNAPKIEKAFLYVQVELQGSPFEKNRLYLWAMPSPGKRGGAHMQLTYCKPSFNRLISSEGARGQPLSNEGATRRFVAYEDHPITPVRVTHSPSNELR